MGLPTTSSLGFAALGKVMARSYPKWLTTFRNSSLVPAGTGSSQPVTFWDISSTMLLIKILSG
jgi:hypothetical protein